MKTLILPIAILSSLAVSAQVAKGPSTTDQEGSGGGAATSTGTPASPASNLNAVAYPWQTGAGFNAGRLSRLLTDLQEDIDSALSTTREADGRGNAEQAAPPPSVPPVAVSQSVAMQATGFGQLPARDLSSLQSQNLSENLSQNLATSLAVPTCPPWSTWNSGPVMVLANINGQAVGIPALPPRTAWGNGLGVVVTAGNGAVYTLVPGYRLPSSDSNSRGTAGPSPELVRQLEIVQDDLHRVIRYLATVNTTNAAPQGTTPGEAPANLSPTGRK